MRKTKEQKAITLVALIITTIVLLILAVVAIRAVTGDGIIQHAENAKTITSQAQIEEEVKLALSELKIEENLTPMEKEEKIDWIENKLKATITENELYTIIDYKENKVALDSNLSIQYIFNAREWDKDATPIGVFQWKSDDSNSPDYGTVIGYKPEALKYKTLKYPSRCTKIITGYTRNVVGVEKVEIPPTVVEFGNKTFGMQSSQSIFVNLKEVIVEKGVTSLSQGMFLYCPSLEKVTLPDGITSIPSEAFRGCTNLTQINIPNTVTTIEGSAFRECTNLKQITIPDSVTSIGYIAFAKCTSIESIVIPKSVVTMAMSVFSGWTSNQTIYVTFNSAKEKPSDWNATWANRRKNCLWLYRRIDRI